jgi:peptide-methionine (S)-S-oxide reductase
MAYIRQRGKQLMIYRYFVSSAVLVLIVATMVACSSATASATAIPDPTLDAPLASSKGEQTAVLAGGCFWGVEAVFEHVKGVSDVRSGYSGGSPATAQYQKVGTGETGHAESVRITYDPSQISYGQLLKVFFSVAHDPTELNRQGPDTGTQYRSAIFYSNEEQKRIAQAYIEQLDRAKVFARPIVTQVAALRSFNEAEGYHQDYLAKHPDEPYIVINDQPKVENLRKQLPGLYKAQ